MLHHGQLLKACPALDKNRLRFGRIGFSLKNDIYFKRLNRILMDTCCLGAYHQDKDYFLIVDPFAHCNMLNNPFESFHTSIFNRAAQVEEIVAEIPYLCHGVKPFFYGLLDFGKIVLQYYPLN